MVPSFIVLVIFLTLTVVMISAAVARRNAKAGLSIAVILGAILLWGLFELQRLPYSPPHDMRTLLGGSEVLALRVVIGGLAAPWLAGVIWLIRMPMTRK